MTINTKLDFIKHLEKYLKNDKLKKAIGSIKKIV